MLNKFRKSYINIKTDEFTECASVAMKWHRRGDVVQVNTYFDMPGKTGLHDSVHIPGAHVMTSQEKTDCENRNHCKNIADDLESYANGLVYKCPECGETFEMPVASVGDKYKCPCCHTVNEVDDFEQLSLYDYFEDALDIEFCIGSDKSYRSVQIMVAWGGPNIYINTGSKSVELYWWGDHATYPIDRDACDEIDAWAEEYYSCL